MADLPLTEKGLRQAGCAAERIAALKPEVIYSSPLRRAVQTAEAVGNLLSLPVTLEDGLRDIDYGSWQGLSLKEAFHKYRKDYLLWLHNPQQVQFSNGESLSIVQDRVKSLIKDLREKHSEQSILLVTHKVVCKVLVISLLGADLSNFWQIQQDVACLDIFEQRSVFFMARSINEICHTKNL